MAYFVIFLWPDKMIIVIIMLLLLFFQIKALTGGRAAETRFVISKKLECAKYDVPAYCAGETSQKSFMEGDFIIPDYSEPLKRKFWAFFQEYFRFNNQKLNFLISTEYSHFYVGLKFLLNEYPKVEKDIILIMMNSESLAMAINILWPAAKIYYFGNKHEREHKNCKYMGRFVQEKHFKLTGKLIVCFPVFYSPNNEDLWNNAIFTNLHTTYIVRQLKPVGFVANLSALRIPYKMDIVNAHYYFLPFYHQGVTPSFYAYSPANLQNRTMTRIIDLKDMAARIYITNFCLRNIKYKKFHNFDTFFMNSILDRIGAKNRKKIMNILGPAPLGPDFKCFDLVPRDMKNYEWAYCQYRDVLKLGVPVELENPPLLIYENVVAEYNMRTVYRGLFKTAKRKPIAFFNCMEYYYFFVGLGTFYMTHVPRKLEKEFNIVKVADVKEAQIKANAKGENLIFEDLMDEFLIQNIEERLSALKLPEAQVVCTDNIPVVLHVLRKKYNSVLTEYVPGALFWNNF